MDDRSAPAKTGGCLVPALVLVAATGPVMHLLSLIRQGIGLLWDDYGALGLHYGLLALSGVCAAALIVKRGMKTGLRVLGGIAFVANVAAIGYGAHQWRMQAEEQLLALAVAPIKAPVGILVAPVSNEPDAVASSTAVQNEIEALVRGSGLAGVAETRQVAPIPSEAQAVDLARRLGAQVVVWSVDRGHDAAVIEHHVLGLGAGAGDMPLTPESVLMAAVSRVSFSFRQVPALAEDQSDTDMQVLPLVAAGHSALAAGDPLQAGGFYSATLLVDGISAEPSRELRRLLGVALLQAGRPDLAAQQFAWGSESDAKALVGLGLAATLQGDLEGATSHLVCGIELDPYDPLAYLALAAVSIKQHQPPRAIGAAARAVALKPEWAPAYAMLGMAYELESNIKAAVRAYEACARYAGHLRGLADASTERARAIVENPPTPVPTLTPWPTPTATAVPTEGVYRVQQGDTLQRIADELGVSMDILIELNRLEDPHSLYVGQYLILPEEP
ncbi:MAG: LysM peptidoglycan-binding domain-containing protein [Anaerolineae bacterium]